MFRFVILGAAKIAVKFVDATRRLDDCEVAAVASKSLERAEAFAHANGVERFYDSYAAMLDAEHPDAAYIAVTPNDHFRLTMLCIEKGIPVLCEKAMFQNSTEAKTAFAAAQEKGVFVMEAMWSRFLPTTQTVRQWLRAGRIGTVQIARTEIGFLAPEGEENRYRNPALGGGAAKDITVYAFEQTDYLLEQPLLDVRTAAVWSPAGVDLTDHVHLQYAQTTADLLTTFSAPVEECMVLYGEKGRIVMPKPHYPSEAFLYSPKGDLLEHFRDTVTENGFVYEIREVIQCVQEGRSSSLIVPPETTIACAELFDRIFSEKP